MRNPARVLRKSLVRVLRRLGLWAWMRDAHQRLSVPVCSLIHEAVGSLGPGWVPDGLALRHKFDFEPIFVDPAMVSGRILSVGPDWKSANRHISAALDGRFVVDGMWDANVQPFDVLDSVVQVCAEGRPAAETEEYQYVLTKVRERDFVWTRGVTTEEEVDAYFDRMLAVYQDIQARGYRTQAELGGDTSDEVRVCVDRYGKFRLFGGGSHRLSMAKVLALPAIPVIVKRVHASWAADCRSQFGGSVFESVTRGLHALGVGHGGG